MDISHDYHLDPQASNEDSLSFIARGHWTAGTVLTVFGLVGVLTIPLVLILWGRFEQRGDQRVKVFETNEADTILLGLGSIAVFGLPFGLTQLYESRLCFDKRKGEARLSERFMWFPEKTSVWDLTGFECVRWEIDRRSEGCQYLVRLVGKRDSIRLYYGDGESECQLMYDRVSEFLALRHVKKVKR